MNKENIRRRIRNVTAFAAALLLAASFSLPSGTEIMGERVGNAIVASAEEYNDFYYEVNSDGETVTITGYSGGNSIVTIPGEIDGKTVTAVGDWAFEDKSSLRTIQIPDSVTSIGDSAFKNCSNLMNINIPDSVTSIGDNAFNGCLYLNIIIPDGVTSIGKSAFNTCVSLVNVKLPENSQFKSIESSTFAGCINLKSITIPNSVESIGENAFERCESLESVTLPSNSSFTSIADYAFISCTSLTSITIPNSVTSIGQNAFESCTSLTSIFIPDGLDVTNASIPASATQIKYSVDDNSNVTITKVTPGEGVTSVTVPDTINGKTVTAVCIKDGTTGVVIPASAAQIKYSVYDNSNVTITKVTPDEGVTSVTVPDTIDGKKVTAVGNSAFYKCSELTSIVLPDGLTYIGKSAFCGCSSLTSIILPDGVTSIGSNAFQACGGLTSIKIPDGVSSIGDFTFYWCSGLKTVELPDGLNSIGSGAFEDCSCLTSINLPDGVTSIGDNAFQSCTGLTSIKIPGSVSSIGNYTFNRCSGLKNVELPDGLNSIGEKAFGECTGLTSINIPKGVTSIESSAFYGCSSFESITVDENNPNYSSEDGVLFNKGKTSLLIYPQNKSDASYEIPNGVDSIGNEIFAVCNNLKSITIPDSVETIGSWAFYSCSSLEIIYIPSSVTSVGNSAFYGCEKLEILLYPQDVDVSGTGLPKTTIQMAYAVDTNNSDNISLTGVKIGSGEVTMTISETIGGKTVTSIGNNALAGCSNLESIIIPKDIDITNAGIPASATQIRYTVDNENVTITSVTLGGEASGFVLPDKIGGKAVTNLANGALASCPKVSHEHREKTAATCTAKAVCAICETGYGETLEHTRESHGMCTVCHDGAQECGENAYYQYNDVTNTLTIFGTGSVTKNDWVSEEFSNSAKNIVIESGITDFDNINCFMEVESISYPDTFITINTHVFRDSHSLTSITIDENNENYCAVDNVIFSKDKTKLYCYLSNNPAEKYDIPEGVTSIEEIAFSACKYLKNITIPSGVQNIGNHAFELCINLESITLPSSVKSVGWYAFYCCKNLETIFIPDGINVSDAEIPGTTTKVFYSTDDSGNASITSIALGTEKTPVDIPEAIGGNKVISVEKDYRQYVGDHTHFGGTATCTEKPVCSICGQGYDEALGHSFTNYVSDNNSTCTENGTETADCDRCDKTDTRVIADSALGHSFTKYVSDKNATCTESGTETAKCDRCDKTDTREEADSALGHDHSGKWQNDTADHWKVCTRNDCEEILDKANHDFDDGVITTEPTEDAEGVKTYTCEICGYEKTEPIAKLNHTHKTAEEYSKDETGHWHACSGCDEKVDFERHTEDSGTVTTEPTETTEGVKTFKCVKCEYVIRTEPIAVLDHTHKTTEEYSKDESGHWHACSNCDEKVDFEKHSFGEGVVTTEPTEETEGVKTFTCKDCGYIKTETIPVTKPSIPETPEEKVNSFVERLYENVLGRPSDPSKETHIDNLTNGETATKVAYDFVFSPEFTELDISNEERVIIMYNTFLNRDPDPAGLETWTNALDNGCSIGHIFYGFTQSGEFGEICEEYGIEQGTWEYTENRDKSVELTSFVSRLYTKALGRKFDVNGLNDHTGTYLENHDLYQMAYNFIFSPEFMEKNLSDEEFVDTMYRTFFDREGDPVGKADWLGKLKSGCSREEVLAGFVYSQECADMVAKFGI